MTLPVLEKYELVQELGAGGMATLFRAFRRSDGRPCAIKVLHEQLAKDNQISARFLREAQVAAELDHPNIARLLDARAENGLFYIAMELIAGRDLEETMEAMAERGETIPIDVAVHIATRVLDALHHAHERQDSTGQSFAIVHRDVNPKNVMLGYDGAVKLIDFGVASARLGAYRTTPGMVIGTLRYMSPEQAMADPVDRRSDIYSLCAVLYELITGRPVIVASNQMDILRRVVSEDVDVQPLVSAGVPDGLIRAILRGLDKSAEGRPPSARVLRDEIRAATHDRRASAANVVALLTSAFGAPDVDSPWSRFDEAGATVQSTRVERGFSTSSSAPTATGRARWWLGGAAFLAAFGLLAFLSASEPDEVVMVPIAPEVVDEPRPQRPIATPARVEPRPAEKPSSKAIVARPAAPVSVRKKVIAAPPKGGPSAPKSERPLARIRRELRRIESGAAEPRELLRVSEQIRALASTVEDPELRARIRSRVRASAMVGDVGDVKATLDLLARTQRAEERR